MDTIVYGGPGLPPGTRTWLYEDVPCDCRGEYPPHAGQIEKHVTPGAIVGKIPGDRVQADLEDGSDRSRILKDQIERGLARLEDAAEGG